MSRRFFYQLASARFRGVSYAIPLAIFFSFGLVTAVAPFSRAADHVPDLIQRGIKERKARNYETAVDLHREAVRLAPDDPNVCAEAAYSLLLALEDRSLPDVLGRSLWLAPADWRKHSQSPYCWSLLGEAGVPSEAAFDETYPLELLEARELAERAVQAAPDNPDAQACLGAVLFNMGDFRRSASALNRALELAPEVAKIHVYCANLSRREKKYADALKHLGRAVQLEPNHIQYRLNRAVVLDQSGETQKALSELEELSQTHSQDFIVRFEYASALEKVGRWSEAAAEFEECIEIDPKGLRPCLGIARCHLGLKSYDTALQWADRAAALDPRGISLHQIRWVAFHGLGRHEDALREIERAIALRPFYPISYLNRSVYLNEFGRSDEASQAKRRAQWLAAWMKIREKVRKEPESFAAWGAAGMIALEGEEWEAAKTCYSKLVELHPVMQPVADSQIAQAHLGLGEYEEAAAAATRALEQLEALRPDEANPKDRATKQKIEEAVLVRAEANLALGRLDAAIADFEAKQAFGSDVGRAYRLRAAKREAAGDMDGAAADRERAALLDPLGEGS